MKCERCYIKTNRHTVSMFNTENICMDCKQKEREHSEFENARKAEHAQLIKGNYNFIGIGKPEDL
jgi:ribonuclease HIII